MTNTDGDHHSGEEVKALLLRFPNVILMANGHTHRNEIRAHARPADHAKPGGFWEVSAAAHIDWPIQSRVIEIAAGKDADGKESISVFTTVLDIDAPLVQRRTTSAAPRPFRARTRTRRQRHPGGRVTPRGGEGPQCGTAAARAVPAVGLSIMQGRPLGRSRLSAA